MKTCFLVIFSCLLLLSLGSNTMTLTSPNVTCIESERQSLLAFKENLLYVYDLLSTWSGVECCEWKGVGCDSRNGHVVKLDLRPPPIEDLEYHDLLCSTVSGLVPPHLGNLSRLQYLDLSIYGCRSYTHVSVYDLEWVSSLSSLRHLDLSYMSIGKIDWFHPINMLPSLLTLNLAGSEIDLPSMELANFTSLNSLDLSHNGINSTIPIWLSNLTNLMHLNLEVNYFHGEIPDSLRMCSALVFVNLSFNSFDTLFPDSLCNFSSLATLDLSWNKFSGGVPECLGQLLRLEDLSLSHNQLSGNIPTCLWQLPNLKTLDFSYNSLVGDISTSFWQLSNLKNLDLSYNSLVGVLSETHFTGLKNLEYLKLSFNLLVLNFSSRWTAPFQLQIFRAPSCNVGPYFPNWLQTQTELHELDLFNSSIRDSIPEWFENIMSHIQYLDLSHNQINGKLPRFHGNNSNQIVKMNSNKFEGTLVAFPPNAYTLDLSDNLLSGHLPKVDGTSLVLTIINLSKNRFTGSIPVHLCEVYTIQVLDLSQNMFSGRLPRCLGNLYLLSVMDLGNNNLTGRVPGSLGSIYLLDSLHLQNNRFEGDIPISFQNLTNLVTMDLGNNLFKGSIPYWIGEKISHLRNLDLHLNKFTGEIPLQLCQLSRLQYLNLAHNNITGTIPHCFGNLSAMKVIKFKDYYIRNYQENILASIKGIQLKYTTTINLLTSLDLSDNNIVEKIPDSLMNLVGLNSLNLSGNLLQGQIPMAIGDLKQLESLDLSLNSLSGRIPQSLIALYSLSYLNLSFNSLYGPIPVGNQLQTLDDPSIYKGNNGLCGPPVSSSCNRNDVSENHANKDEGKDDTDGLWFYAGMGPGFAVGLLGLLGSLHFIRSWRLAYFEMLEDVYGWLMLSIQLNLARLRRKISE